MFSSSHAHLIARTWWKENVPRPWMCSYCDDEVVDIAANVGVVHHVDEDPNNNVRENLQAMHAVCHKRHHQIGKTRSPETCQKMRGRVHTADVRQRISDANRGRVLTDAHRAKLREAWVRRKQRMVS